MSGRALRLDALEDERDFALVGPGFTGDGWRLLRGLRRVRRGEQPAESLWFARAETAGADAVWLTGQAEDVEVDVGPEPFAEPGAGGANEARQGVSGTAPGASEPVRRARSRGRDDGDFSVTLEDTGFLDGVTTIRERIAAGDVYQVNLTVRATVQCGTGAALLRRLCRRGVPRFASWVKAARVGEVVSASPELLFELVGRTVRAEPMKGTAGPDARAWLEQSAKDAAELAMITDLLRDDLNRLCEPRSVHVPNARRFLELPYAVQAVSDVVGTLPAGGAGPGAALAPPGGPREEGPAARAGAQHAARVRAVLSQLHPGGSVTGAPRPAALALIAALERSPRGAYCGTLAFSRGDATRAALLIRTAQRATPETWTYGVGGGITWDSTPHAELEEVHLKLGALR